MLVHSTAIIHEGAVLGADCEIGPNCIVGPNVVLGDRVKLISNVVVDGRTTIGDDSIVYPFAVLGLIGQDLKWQDENSMTGLTIGKRCRIREYVTIHSGTPASDGTTIGDDCQIMAQAHVAHDCNIGNNVVLSNLVQVAGHVKIEDFATLSAGVMVLQFSHIGRNSFITAMSRVTNDVLPYAIYEGDSHAEYRTINRIGLRRHGFTTKDMHAIHAVYNAVFSCTESVLSERLTKMREEVKNKYALDAIDFIENRSNKGNLIIHTISRKTFLKLSADFISCFFHNSVKPLLHRFMNVFSYFLGKSLFIPKKPSKGSI
ncbi:acyl-ACP--UDP-N-acetylglucosamine O-acyltransferase [bacterium]|nr:acyl-ACP--UDP-N-acetylglucosamine O-acyltransferase [bacterium]